MKPTLYPQGVALRRTGCPTSSGRFLARRKRSEPGQRTSLSGLKWRWTGEAGGSTSRSCILPTPPMTLRRSTLPCIWAKDAIFRVMNAIAQRKATCSQTYPPKLLATCALGISPSATEPDVFHWHIYRPRGPIRARGMQPVAQTMKATRLTHAQRAGPHVPSRRDISIMRRNPATVAPCEKPIEPARH